MEEAAVLATLHADVFGTRPGSITPLRGDGSSRRIYRLASASVTSIGIAGDNVAENDAFIGFSRTFHAAGLPVPELLAVAPRRHCYLEEDLGDVTLHAWMSARREGCLFPEKGIRMYETVLSDLVRFQIDCADAVDYGLCYQTREFGEAAMRADLQYFSDMFLSRYRPDLSDTAGLERDAATFIGHLLTADRRFFLYRDFQSRNVMISAQRPRYIDYQSGRRGALMYDVASLLFDAKARIPVEVRDVLLAHYLDEVERRASGGHPLFRAQPFDRAQFLELWPAYCIMRVLQALGAFGNLGARQGKPGFLSAIPPALDNVALLAGAPVLSRTPWLRHVLAELAADMDLRTIMEE